MTILTFYMGRQTNKKENDYTVRESFHRFLLLLLGRSAASSGREVNGVIGNPVSFNFELHDLTNQPLLVAPAS